MLDTVTTGSRLYRRLAEGVRRTRLIGPILASRPSLVLIAAPSGYGKTVLAAQIGAAGQSDEVIWIDCGGGGAVDDDLARLATALPSPPNPATRSMSPAESCNSAFAGMPDERTVVLVMDDAGWAVDDSALALLESAIAEAPTGTIAVVTCRDAGSLPAAPIQAWRLGIEELRLTDAETREAWVRLTGVSLDEVGVRSLVESSGRHFALLSLLGRNASLMGAPSVPERCSPSVASLLQGLVYSQLDGEESDLLHCAAILGEGGIADLGVLSGQTRVRQRLTRISEVIPLVSVSGDMLVERFAVHDLVSSALDSARSLAGSRASVLTDAILLLESRGRASRALEVAVRSGDVEVTADCIERVGSRLLKGSGWECVCDAIDELPSAAIASRPALLLVKAEAEWACGRRAEGIHQAELAIRIEELAGPGGALPHAHALLAGMRMVLADFSGIVAEVGPLMQDATVRASDEYGEILYAAIAAFGLLGDRAGLNTAIEEATTLAAHHRTSPYVLSHIDSARASVLSLLDGDSRTAMRLMRGAALRDGIPSHWRVNASCNVAALALECGELDTAGVDLSAAVAAVANTGAPSDHAIRHLLSQTLHGLSGEAVEIAAAIERLLECCAAESERFTYVFTCVRGVEVALCLRETAYARDLSERGAALALETGSPVLLWLAELVQAQALLAVGELERARKTAERLLPRVESISAMGHVLHARMILAETALRDGDLPAALQHLAAVSDYIVDKTPGLVAASYLRCFPDLLGPLAHVMGVERIPAGVLRCLAGPYAEEALVASESILTKSELSALRARMHEVAGGDAQQAGTATTPQPPVEVRLFGGLEVRTAHGVVAQRDWGKRKARLLFAMLVARQGMEIHRAEMIDYLWPDLDEAHGVNNFYVVWSAMKRAVAPRCSESVAPFENHNGVCRIVPERVESDLDQFMKARAEARYAKSVADTAGELTALNTALDLYRGDVLPGDIYDDWFGGIRQVYRQEYEASVIRFATIMLEAGDPLGALPAVMRAFERESLREDLYQARIRLEIASNQRGAAMDTYLTCRHALVEQLGVDPSRETVELYQQILAMEDPPEDSQY